MTLLSTVQNAMALCSLTVPSVVYASQDDNVKQMIRLLMVEGRDLVKRHDWNILLIPTTFTCGASNAQSGTPPAAFDRMSRGVGVWNDSNEWMITGPVTADEWVELITRNVSTLPQYWRLIGGVLNIEPPSSGDTIRYEYVSNQWIKQAGVTLATTLTADTDTFVFPENILELGLVWRFKQAKQLDYAEDMRTYELHVKQAIESDKGGRRILSTTRAVPVRAGRTWYGTITPS